MCAVCCCLFVFVSILAVCVRLSVLVLNMLSVVDCADCFCLGLEVVVHC